jgi:hypothetical protein
MDFFMNLLMARGAIGCVNREIPYFWVCSMEKLYPREDFRRARIAPELSVV